MHETVSLNLLAEGESAYVIQLDHTGSLQQRLTDLGLIQGTRVTCLYRSPAGDPAAYLIRGAVIALRRQDASHIQVSPLPSVSMSAEVPVSWA